MSILGLILFQIVENRVTMAGSAAAAIRVALVAQSCYLSLPTMAQSSASFDLLQSSLIIIIIFNNSYKALFFNQSFNSLMGVYLLKVSSE